jgi:hypothetical protein
MKITVYWNETSYSVVAECQHVRRTYCFCLLFSYPEDGEDYPKYLNKIIYLKIDYSTSFHDPISSGSGRTPVSQFFITEWRKLTTYSKQNLHIFLLPTFLVLLIYYRSPCWDCDRRNCAVGGRVDSTWQKDNDRQYSSCTRVFRQFHIRVQHNAWSFEVLESVRTVGAQRTEGSRKNETKEFVIAKSLTVLYIELYFPSNTTIYQHLL